ncbi:hypothetical protein NDU88_001056 [Pleurodeles waltl]|uniref:Uncharacterized protein n=1 Tax=Pleurodeles waltl TaxID=8319 RepID=A0AAV7LXG5_PLEWA|nr:hypothetical protein NDU88_001056 [Pleurodeles waltl]
MPFSFKQDFLKILGVWFRGEGAAEKSWEERLAKTKQKLGLWSLRKLMIEGKSLALRNETLPVLQYVSKKPPGGRKGEDIDSGLLEDDHSLLNDYAALDRSDSDDET